MVPTQTFVPPGRRRPLELGGGAGTLRLRSSHAEQNGAAGHLWAFDDAGARAVEGVHEDVELNGLAPVDLEIPAGAGVVMFENTSSYGVNLSYRPVSS